MEILPPFRVSPKCLAEFVLWLFWFVSHLILFGEKTWRTFVWHGNQYGSEQRLHRKTRRPWVRKLEVIQGDLEEDHRSGDLRLCCPSPKGLTDTWVTDIKTEEINELLLAQDPFHCIIKYLLIYLGTFVIFFLDTTPLNAFDFHAYSQVFQIRPSFTETILSVLCYSTFHISGLSIAAFAPKCTVAPLIFYDVFLALQNWRSKIWRSHGGVWEEDFKESWKESKGFCLFVFKLEYNCFTMLCYFLLYNQVVSHMCTCIPFLLDLPPIPHPIPPL